MATMTRQLARPDWEGFFQRFTRRYLATADDRPQTATVEVCSLTIGDQYDATTVRLLGLSYDPRSNAFEVLLEDVGTHLVYKPAEIWVMEDDEGFLSTLEVLHDDGSKEIIYMHRSGPLARLLTGPPASP